MAATIFDTPILTGVLQRISIFLLAVFGWKIEGRLPDLPKFVLIGVPHTSNWDFVIMLAAAFAMHIKISWMGKSSLFRWPFGTFFRWCGGIAIDRSKPNGVVEEMKHSFNQSARLILVIAPEGTRGRVGQWKTGFYHIARSAVVPIVPAYLDFSRKILVFGVAFTPDENMEQDMISLQTFYKEKQND